MLEINETHEKIIEILKNKGPRLPIQMAKEIGMNSLFISAFLSELTNEKKVKVSNLKVGGSPLYFLEEDAEQLEKFNKFLHPKEAEAFFLIKKNKILKDSEQEPAIRVALRSIKDFVIGFKKNEEIYWKYLFIPKEEENILFSKPKLNIEKKLEINEKEDISHKNNKEIKNEFKNPLIIKKDKSKKDKPKSEFVLKVIDFINHNFRLLEEKNFKIKEYNCLIQIKSELGFITFLTQAKDKKTISETDLKKLLSDAQSIPLPALFIYNGNLSKKAKEFSKKYLSILKTKKI